MDCAIALDTSKSLLTDYTIGNDDTTHGFTYPWLLYEYIEGNDQQTDG